MLHQNIKLSFILGGFGALFILLGMATPGWLKDSNRDTSAGLYLFCIPGGCLNITAGRGSIYAARAFIMIAFFCAIGGLVNSAVYYKKYFTKSIENRRLPNSSAIVFFISAGTCLVASIIFATAGLIEMEAIAYIAFSTRFNFSVYYSLGLAIVGALGSAAAGLFTVFHLKREAVQQGAIINPH